MKRLALLALALTACTVPAKGTIETDNAGLLVERLVVIQGCNVYRFEDGGHDHYVTICPSGDTSTSAARSVSNGKTTHTEIDEVQAVRSPCGDRTAR